MFELPDSADWSGERPAARSGAGVVVEVVTGFGHGSRRWVERVLVPAAVERLDEAPGELLAAAIEDVRAGLGEVWRRRRAAAGHGGRTAGGVGAVGAGGGDRGVVPAAVDEPERA